MKEIEKEKIERQLIPRLRTLGLILLSFSLFAFVYSFFPEGKEEELLVEEKLLVDFQEPPPLNIYIVASALALVGTVTVVTAWRKKNAAKAQTPDR